MGYRKVIKSGYFVESFEYEKSLQPHQTGGRKGSYDSGYRKNTARRADNVKRAITAFRRLVWSNALRDQDITLLTFTMFEKLSVDTSWGFFTKFFDSFRDRVGNKDLKYIAVLEFQPKSGNVHFHVLVWGLPDHFILHEGSTGTRKYGERSRKRFAEWLEKKGYSVSEMRNDRTIQNLWRRGYVDCLPTDGSPALAYYLSNYLAPTLRDVRLGGRRGYSASRNVLRPVFTGSSEFTDSELEELGVSGDPLYHREFSTEWQGKCWYDAFDITGKVINESAYKNMMGWTMAEAAEYKKLLIHSRFVDKRKGDSIAERSTV